MESKVELGNSGHDIVKDDEIEHEIEHQSKPFYKNKFFLIAVGLVVAGGIAAAIAVPLSMKNDDDSSSSGATATDTKTITTFNTGLFGTVANYDQRRNLFMDAFKKNIDTDIFCQNELWYGKDLQLMEADAEWNARYPYKYFYNNEEMQKRESGEAVSSLCPPTTMATVMGLMAVPECKEAFTTATTITNKDYEALKDDLFVLLDCWKEHAAEKFMPIYNNRACYGCLINAGTSGDMMSMTKCMQGSTAAAPNDHAFESFLYGLVLWSKTPMENAGGKNMTWNVVPRGYLSGEFDLNGEKAGIICTHVGVEGPEQQDQFVEITDFVKTREAAGVKNWFLAGDLNSGPANADGTIAENPDRESTGGVSSTEKLTELGWWGIYNHMDFLPTWDLPMDAAGNYFDGNTNICGHTTGIDCNSMGANDQRKMLLDHLYVRGDALPQDVSHYSAKRIFDEKFNVSADYEGVHISDHYGLQFHIH